MFWIDSGQSDISGDISLALKNLPSHYKLSVNISDFILDLEFADKSNEATNELAVMKRCKYSIEKHQQ